MAYGIGKTSKRYWDAHNFGLLRLGYRLLQDCCIVAGLHIKGVVSDFTGSCVPVVPIMIYSQAAS